MPPTGDSASGAGASFQVSLVAEFGVHGLAKWHGGPGKEDKKKAGAV